MTIISNNTAAGFGPLGISDFLINEQSLTVDVKDAIEDATVNRTISTASTVTLQIDDPLRKILRSAIFQYGANLTVSGLSFTLVEITKASDTLQIVFESSGVAALRMQTGVQATTTSTDITTFIRSLVQVIPGLGFSGQVGAVNDGDGNPVSIGRGTQADPSEDSWTCIQRVATSAGWRCFEVNNVVYLGSDQWLLGSGSAGVLQEFSVGIQNIDFDYDIGKPFGTATVTGMSNLWAYNPGQVVETLGMGPLDGQPWLIQSCQRDLYNPQMSAVIYAPQTPFNVINPPTYAPF